MILTVSFYINGFVKSWNDKGKDSESDISTMATIAWENAHYAMCAETATQKKPAHARDVIGILAVRVKNLCILGYPKCAQGRFRSDCAYAQSDLNLRWAHMSEGQFSEVKVSLCNDSGKTRA